MVVKEREQTATLEKMIQVSQAEPAVNKVVEGLLLEDSSIPQVTIKKKEMLTVEQPTDGSRLTGKQLFDQNFNSSSSNGYYWGKNEGQGKRTILNPSKGEKEYPT